MIKTLRSSIFAGIAIGETVKSVEVTEEELSSFYVVNKARFQKGETVSAKHILVKEEATCQEILSAINSGEKSFEEASEKFSKVAGNILYSCWRCDTFVLKAH